MNIGGGRILVIGGARRLGRALAIDLAAHGADVAVSSRTPSPAAVQAREAILTLGRRAVLVNGDLATPGAAATLVDQAAAGLGGLDALVYAASGPFAAARPEEIDTSAWDASLDAIARGFFFAATAAYRAFAANPPAPGNGSTRGVIVAITDVLGLRPPAMFAAHAAAKAAQIMLVQTLAKAWAADGVRVCGVAPGPTRLDDETRPEALARAADRTLLKRPAEASEIGAAVRFCLENDYLTGQNIAVDGGALLA